MKKYLTFSAIALLSASLSGQIIEEMDALKYSRSQIMGSARYMSMAGAFTSLGGEVSSINQNPAGIAVFPKSEISGTLNLRFLNTKVNQNGSTNSEDLTKFSLDNIGYVGAVNLKNSGSGIMNWNFGFVYNRTYSFDRNYYGQGNTSGYSSLPDYIARKTSTFRPPIYEDEFGYGSDIPWLSVLGYDASLISAIDGGPSYINNFNDRFTASSLKMVERGHVDEYNFALGFNYSHLLYVGLNVGITDMVYDQSSYYNEVFTGTEGSDGYELINHRSLDGSGVNVKIGAIIRPTYAWRLGIAYHSPTFYNMSTSYYGEVRNYNPDYANSGTIGYEPGEYYPRTDFDLRTPQKLLVGTSFIGDYGLVSVDYEYCDYSSIKIKEDGFNVTPPLDETLRGTHTIKIGGEYFINNSFSLRAGYAHITSPVKKEVLDGGLEVFTSGTVPHYTLDKGQNYFSLGFGYRYKSAFVDMAYVLNSYKEDLYAFSPVFDSTSGQQVIMPVVSKLTNNRSNILLTFGVQF
ncbi:MAG: outer membrane protein transport protein [Candidatus Azobacteroides sp.]|nr:outer membrane protein transport protein [Candidatus Azobacteroides sp.]